MTNDEIIFTIAAQVEKASKNETTGHDWWHIYRVWKVACKIGIEENADLFVVQLAALLHDIADWKFNDGNEKAGGIVASKLLLEQNIDPIISKKVVTIVDTVSFKGAKVKSTVNTLEGKVVQDADRLDAIGAIGIARTFAYGGSKGRPLYDPTIKPVLHESFDAYKASVSPTINHFYEKLLLLKDQMNTETGKKLADERHRFMKYYLSQFYDEWTGKI